MAVTVTYDAEGPGSGRKRDVSGAGALRMVTGKLSFDNSYPTGGELFSEIWDQFRGSTLYQLFVQHPIASAGTGKLAVIDYTGKKVMLYTLAGAEVANASDQSGAVTLRFTAIGPA